MKYSSKIVNWHELWLRYFSKWIHTRNASRKNQVSWETTVLISPWVWEWCDTTIKTSWYWHHRGYPALTFLGIKRKKAKAQQIWSNQQIRSIILENSVVPPTHAQRVCFVRVLNIDACGQALTNPTQMYVQHDSGKKPTVQWNTYLRGKRQLDSFESDATWVGISIRSGDKGNMLPNKQIKFTVQSFSLLLAIYTAF